MSSPLLRKLEISANVAIIAVAILVGILLVRNYLIVGHSKPQPQNLIGTKISLPDIDWANNGQTLLLVLQRGCRFCSESAPFYQRLVRDVGNNGNIRLVAVLPQEITEGKQYLQDLGVSINEVKQALPSSLGVRGTPTLLLVNDAGIVTETWNGKLPAEKESEVLNRLQIERTSK